MVNELTKEEKLLRKGNLINTLGVLRALSIDNRLTKDKYIQLVKRTYTVNEEYLKVIEKRAIDAWIKAKERLTEMEILDISSSTDDLYVKKKLRNYDMIEEVEESLEILRNISDYEENN